MSIRGITHLGAAGLLLVLIIDLCLVATIATELLSGSADVADRADWNANLAASATPVAKQKPMEAYREIVAHPVFNKSREPWVASPPPAPVAITPSPPPPPVDPGLALGGVVIRNDSKKAYVFTRARTDGVWLREGEDFMGWKVVSINKGAAKLQQAGRSIELALYPEQ